MKNFIFCYFLVLFCFISCKKETSITIDCDQVSIQFQEAQSTFLSESSKSNCESYLDLMIKNQEDCGVSNVSSIAYYTEQCPCMDIYQEIIEAVTEWSNDPSSESKCQTYKEAIMKAIETPNCDEDGSYQDAFENLDC